MEAFRLIYERYHRDVYRFALFLTGDPARADDLSAETFLRAWTAREAIRQDTIKAYLLTIARNLYRDQLRSKRQFVELEDTIEDNRPSLDVYVEHRSAIRRVRTAMRRVPRSDRRALLLYVYREMSYAEIAAALGITVGATKSRIRRAREALSGALASRITEEP